MKTKYELIMLVKQKPELYLWQKSFTKFIDFMFGYDFCLNGLVEKNYDEQILVDFDKFIRSYYKIDAPNRPWTKIIPFFSISDEDAFNEFYLVFDKYLQANPELLKVEEERQKRYHSAIISFKRE